MRDPLSQRERKIQQRLLLAIAVLCALLLGLVSSYGNHEREHDHEVTCRAPADEWQKLTVRVIKQNGVLQESCEYAPLGFGA